jgi:hypothetical protein
MKVFVALFFALNFLTAQKVVKKSIVDSVVSSFQIDASDCFEINVETVKSDEILVEATIDGEYKKDLGLNVRVEGSTILVSAGFQPNFIRHNDKLSAHKVVSIALNIKLPENRNVTVFGTSCNIIANGVYKKLKVTLNDGACTLINVAETAEVTTQSGDIYIESKSGNVIGTSKYGNVSEDKLPLGDTKYMLSTVTGDILIKRIE